MQDVFWLTCHPQLLDNPFLSTVANVSMSEDNVSTVFFSISDWNSVSHLQAVSLAAHLPNMVMPGLDASTTLKAADLLSHQKQAPADSRVLCFVEQKRCRLGVNIAVRGLHWDKLTLLDGILYRVSKDPLTKCKGFQFVVPNSLKSVVLSGVHDYAGHQGQSCTLYLAHQHYFWHDREKDVCSHVRNSHRCVLSKTPEPAVRAPLESIKTTSPLALVCIDVWSSKHNNNKAVDSL